MAVINLNAALDKENNVIAFYVAEVIDIVMENNKPMVQKVVAAVDCGIVVNPDAGANMGEGCHCGWYRKCLFRRDDFREWCAREK